MSMVYVRTKSEIECELRRLAGLVHESADVSGIEAEIDIELGQLECDISNRAGIERGEIEP